MGFQADISLYCDGCGENLGSRRVVAENPDRIGHALWELKRLNNGKVDVKRNFRATEYYCKFCADKPVKKALLK